MATPTSTYDPDKVMAALLANADRLRATVSTPVVTPFYDPDKILDALYKNAELLRAQADQDFASKAVSIPQESQLYVSYHLLYPNAPLALSIVTGVLTLLAAFIFLFSGAISTRWGSSFKVNEKRLLQGGFGGILSGYGTSTLIIFLPFVLLKSPPKLSSVAFYAIFAAGSIPLAILAGRFKWIGRSCMALSAGVAIAANLILSARPSSLLPRLVILAIFTVLSVLTTVILPLVVSSINPIIASRSLVFFTSLGTGSYLFGCAIELMSSKKLGWVDSIGLFAGEDINLDIQNDWGKSTQFKGLIAGCWLIGFIGLGWQLWRWREVGDDPDEQWNSYLGKLINNEKDAHFKSGRSGGKRKGVFVPEPSFWQKLMGRSSNVEKVRPLSPLFDEEKADSPLTDLPEKKHIRQKDKDLPWEDVEDKKARSPQRYDPHDADITDDFDDDAKTLTGSIDYDFHKRKEYTKVEDFEESQPKAILRKQSTATTLSGTTVVGSEHQMLGKQIDYSDESSSSSESEEGMGDMDAGNIPHDKKKRGMVSSLSKMFGGQSRRPARYNGVDSSDRSRSLDTSTALSPTTSRASRPVSRQSQHRPIARSARPASISSKSSVPNTSSVYPISPTSATKTLVPATPSLIKAIDRIQEAQRQARGDLSAVTELTEPVSDGKPAKTNDLWANLDNVQRKQSRDI